MAVKIYIDQGHNPKSPNTGAEGNGYKEQDIVYDIGRRLAYILRINGFDTKLSRPTPETQLGTSNATSLLARVNDANAWGADYFISLHTNAVASSIPSGSEALVYSLGTVAARMGEDILEQLHAATGLRNRGVKARPELFVLKKTKMPAVLVELGFISNPTDAELMANEPDLFAQAVADGIMQYLASNTAMAGESSIEKKAAALDVSAQTDPSVYRAEPSVSAMANANEAPPSKDNVAADESGKTDEKVDRSAHDETEDEGEYSKENDSTPLVNQEMLDFFNENNRHGLLKMQAFRGNQSFPVPGVRVKISKIFEGEEYIFFEGTTNSNGIIDFIELPAPPRGNSLNYELPDKSAVYTLKATHPNFMTIEDEVEIFECMKGVQPLEMLLKGER